MTELAKIDQTDAVRVRRSHPSGLEHPTPVEIRLAIQDELNAYEREHGFINAPMRQILNRAFAKASDKFDGEKS